MESTGHTCCKSMNQDYSAEYLYSEARDISNSLVFRLLTFLSCLKFKPFHQGNFYQQTEGVAIGLPVSPKSCQFFLGKKMLTIFHCPLHYQGNYMYDTMFILHKDMIVEFPSHLNSQHLTIKFPHEITQHCHACHHDHQRRQWACL